MFFMFFEVPLVFGPVLLVFFQLHDQKLPTLGNIMFAPNSPPGPAHYTARLSATLCMICGKNVFE
jgi:hypothetical protein